MRQLDGGQQRRALGKARAKAGLKLVTWRVCVEVGDPDWGYVERRVIETQAATRDRAISNARYRVRLDVPLRVVDVEQVEEI